MKMRNAYQGYWNGIKNIEYICVTYEVAPSDGEFHWQNMYVGQRRQGVMIAHGKETWVIDNEHGDGYYKVTVGMGSPSCGHKSVVNPLKISEIPTWRWNKKYDVEGMRKENDLHDQWIKEKDPEQYKKLEALRKVIVRNEG